MKSLLSVCFLLLLVSSALGASSSGWTVVDKDYATIAIALAFQSDTSGWVVGGSSDLQPLTLHTNDAGATLQNAGIENVDEAALMSVRFAPDGMNGVAGSLGFFGLICGAYTNNGANWTKTHEGDDLICASQGAAVPDSNTFVLVGQWTSPKEPQGDGVQISTDAGQTWTGQDWNMGTESRYASFISQDLGFVTGGTWPEENQTDAFSYPKRITKHLLFTGKNIQFAPQTKKLSGPSAGNGYQAVIAQATSAASQWNLLVNLTNQGLYFNQISCLDSMNCWATAEGNNVTTGAVAAWIFATTDGWQTYETQLYFEGGSLVPIQMISPTFGWAGGALVPEDSRASLEGAFFKTTDGKTWTQDGTIRGFYAMDISVVDQNNAFAAGITDVGLSSLARYTSS